MFQWTVLQVIVKMGKRGAPEGSWVSGSGNIEVKQRDHGCLVVELRFSTIIFVWRKGS